MAKKNSGGNGGGSGGVKGGTAKAPATSTAPTSSTSRFGAKGLIPVQSAYTVEQMAEIDEARGYLGINARNQFVTISTLEWARKTNAERKSKQGH